MANPRAAREHLITARALRGPRSAKKRGSRKIAARTVVRQSPNVGKVRGYALGRARKRQDARVAGRIKEAQKRHRAFLKTPEGKKATSWKEFLRANKRKGKGTSTA